jgi:16S rRNA (adenine1518-N6/adenine1519-N6)-dimethyltransferase
VPKPRKQFAQHWLRSEKALQRIVAAAELQPTDTVLEIGPGTGALTRQLLALSKTVIAVEIDRDLCDFLARKIGGIENFLLLQGDFLTLDLAALLAPLTTLQLPNKVVANIPYNITGPILEKLLGTIANSNSAPFDLIVLLLQKEVALRLCANPGSKHAGALTMRVQYLAECEFICDVPAGAFQPPPKVDSAVVRLRPRSLATPASHPAFLETLLKLGFANKRKMLRNNLQGLVERDRLTQLLHSLEIPDNFRAEQLSLMQWIALSDLLSSDLSANPDQAQLTFQA